MIVHVVWRKISPCHKLLWLQINGSITPQPVGSGILYSITAHDISCNIGMIVHVVRGKISPCQKLFWVTNGRITSQLVGSGILHGINTHIIAAILVGCACTEAGVLWDQKGHTLERYMIVNPININTKLYIVQPMKYKPRNVYSTAYEI